MNCLELDRLMYPYLDGELLPDERLELEQHFAGCASCAQTVDAERRALEIVRSAARAGTPKAPESLKLSLLAGIRGEEKKVRTSRYLRLSAAAAGVALCTFAAHHQWRSFQRQRFIEDVTARYARGYPLEIQQRDPRTLATWFENKLNHRVIVPRFPNATAAGARLLNVRSNQAALIRYDTQRPGEGSPRSLGLFVYQADEDDVAALPNTEFGSANGFNVVGWRDGDVVYRLVSDLDEQDVRSLLPESAAAAAGAPRIEATPVSLQR